jgi:hypothetical protein
MMTRGIRLQLVLLLVAAPACSKPGDSPRATAEAFLDAHYVHIDLDSSRALTSGLARAKVEKELELTANVEIDAETRKPRITYALEEERTGEAAVQYSYELTIRPPGVDSFTRLVTLTVRPGEGSWSVTNYNDSAPPTGR